MTGCAQESGRGRVRERLLNPLIRAGMKKSPRLDTEAYADMLTRLADKLSHLSDEELAGIAVWITRFAKGKERNIWPDEVSIVAQAYFMRPPPPRKNDFVISVLRSEAGRRALSLGYLVELYMALLKFGPPFTKYSLDRLARKAAENQRERARVKRMIDTGRAPEERMQWLDWYEGHERAAREIMSVSECDERKGNHDAA